MSRWLVVELVRLPELVRVGHWGVRVVRGQRPGEQRLLVHGARRHDLGRAHLLHLLYRLLLLLRVKVRLVVARDLQLGLDLPQLPPGQHLDVGADLLPGPGLAGPELDVPRYQLVPAVHLPLVREDDLPPAAGRVDGQRLLEALLYLRSPDPLRVLSSGLLVIVELAGVELGDLRADGLGDPRESHGVITLQQVCQISTPVFVVVKIDHLLKGCVIKTF